MNRFDKNLGPKNFGFEKKFWSERNLGPAILLGPLKIFGLKKIVESENFRYEKILGLKKF